MHLWLIKRTAVGRAGSPRYDTFSAHVVAAETPLAVRVLANGIAADEGRIWDNPALARVQRLGDYTGRRTRAHIVLSSFNAG